MHGFLGEFLGTMILIIIGAGTCCGNNLNKSYGKGSGWLFICTSWGLAVTMGVYVAGVFGSLGHLNPAVTIPEAIFGMFPWSQVVPYLLGQFLGAFVGAVIVIIHYWPQFKETKGDEEGNNVSDFATRPAIWNPTFNFLSELIATFTFVFTILNLGNFTQGLKPLIVGFVIMIVGTGLGETTGFALNPARDWGPRIAYSIIPVPNKSKLGGQWNYAWVPMCGPLAGGIIACGLEVLIH